MGQYLLDTNHASPLVTIGHPLRTLFFDRSRAGDEFFIAAPAIAELWFGFCLTPRSRSNRQEWEKLETVIESININEVDAKAAASLRYVMRLKGHQLQTVDSLIAAIAVRFDLTLLTTDLDFTAVPGLRIENWLHRNLGEVQGN